MSAVAAKSAVSEVRRAELGRLGAEVAACRACERLVSWREQVASTGRRAYAGETYWARAIPGFGDPGARLCVVGLAPAAHGGNRTGRMFTGDRSGDFLFAALHRAGFSNQPTSTGRDDGLELDGAYITAPVRCAPPENKPTPAERAACAPFLRRELALLPDVAVFLALGAYALDALFAEPLVGGMALGRKPRFSHGAQLALAPLVEGGPTRTLLCSYHPSQRNVFTGLLTEAMFDEVLRTARALCEAAAPPGALRRSRRGGAPAPQ